VVPLGNGSVFPGNVSLSCSRAGLPPLSTCSFTPSQVASGQRDTNVVLKVTTTSTSRSRLEGAPHLLWHDLGLSLTGVVLAFGGWRKSRRRRKKVYLRLGILGLLLSLLVACGTGSSGGGGGGGGGAGHPGTPPGNYSITVNGAVGSVTRSVQAGLTVQ
jgi:hypothetical protein